MYYHLDVDYEVQNVLIKAEPGVPVSQLIRGRSLAAATPPAFRFTRTVDEGVNGSKEAPVMFSYFPNVSLMERRLVEVVQDAGVDNLEVFPAVIRDAETGEEIHDYVAVNVLGLVACADMALSEADPIADVYAFDNLVIDPDKVQDLLMFRLAESQIEIIVEEQVAAAIEAGGFTGVVLTPLQES